MAELLYRLGRFSARRAWIVIVAWLVIIAAIAAGFLIGFKGLATAFDIPGTASGAVAAELEQKLPEYSGASGVVIYSTTDGSAFTADQKAAIADLVAGAEDLPDVARVVDPFDAEQQRADGAKQVTDGLAQIAAGRDQLDTSQAQLDASAAFLDPAQLAGAQAQLDSAREEVETNAAALERGQRLLDLASGIRTVSDDGSAAVVNVGFSESRMTLPDTSKRAVVDYVDEHPVEGVTAAISSSIAQGIPQVVGPGEIAGVVIAGIVLFIMLGTLIAAAIPVVTALVGVAVGVVGSLSFSGLVEMVSVTPILGVMLGLAVGIDYSLFILNRHRKQMLQGAEAVESIGLANGTAGNAVVFAGTTVIVALLALNVTGIPFLGLMGTVGAVCVAVAVLIAVTLTPALLGLLGTRVLSRRARSTPVQQPKAVRPMSTVRAIVTVLVGAAVLLTVALPAMSMRLGLPDGSLEPAGSSSYAADRITAEQFGEGSNGPLLVTASLSAGLSDDEIAQKQLDVAQAIADQADVAAVAPIAVSDDKTLAAFQVIPDGGPNSVSTETLVRDLRNLPAIDGDTELGVAGQAASNIDISENLSRILPGYLAIVIGLSLLIMIAVFRSLLVPVIATGGFILSLFATYGALTAVFQNGWLGALFGVETPGPIVSFLPVILVGILFGLAMDYQLFLTSGMRESFVHGSPARLAVAEGFRAGRSVVTAAALIMISVFGGFVFSESIIVRALGFGLAFGVLADAFVVRMLIVPAIMHLVGRGAWWIPRWLDRLLPNVDVEGAALERRHHV